MICLQNQVQDQVIKLENPSFIIYKKLFMLVQMINAQCMKIVQLLNWGLLLKNFRNSGFYFSVMKRMSFRMGLMIWDHCDTAVFSKKAKFLRRFYDLHTAVPVLINNIS